MVDFGKLVGKPAQVGETDIARKHDPKREERDFFGDCRWWERTDAFAHARTRVEP